MDAFELAFRPAPPRVCRFRVGVGALDALVEDLASDPPAPRLFIVSDDRVAPLHAEPLGARLERAGFRVDLLAFPEGESSKVRRTKEALEDRLLDLEAGRDSAVLAVGGGVTGDLAGFLASTWHRGLPVVQVPTSLLAMVDAAIGGKTAVNLSRAKNLVGTFHQPWGVYADIAVLETLAEESYREGFAEVVKSATIADRALFERLESTADELLERSTPALEQVVSSCVRIKAAVVRRDARESGRRAMLNFGHTIGHAIEAATGFSTGHGSAVAVGLCAEARIARRALGFPRRHCERLVSLLERFGLPTGLPRDVSRDALIRGTRTDKKARAGQARYALPRRIGSMPRGSDVTVAVEEGMLQEVLDGFANP